MDLFLFLKSSNHILTRLLLTDWAPILLGSAGLLLQGIFPSHDGKVTICGLPGSGSGCDVRAQERLFLEEGKPKSWMDDIRQPLGVVGLWLPKAQLLQESEGKRFSKECLCIGRHTADVFWVPAPTLWLSISCGSSSFVWAWLKMTTDSLHLQISL